jgi:hypothetical protein
MGACTRVVRLREKRGERERESEREGEAAINLLAAPSKNRGP